MKHLPASFWSAILLTAILISGPARADQAAAKETKLFMRQKLTYSQSILEGLTLEKFDLILTNATKMKDMTLTNTFIVLQNPDYLNQMSSFQKSVDSLVSAAERRNIDAATAAYVRVTRSCVQCHRYFRREQRYDSTPPTPAPKKQ